MKKHQPISPIVLLVLVAGTLSLAFYCMTQTTFAHDFQPLTTPPSAACYVAATTCETTRPSAATKGSPIIQQNALPRTVSLTETLATSRPLDGKGWLPHPDLLVSDGAIRAANRRALFDMPCVNGFADIFPCDQVDLLAFLPYTEIGGDTNNTLWGWTDPVTGQEYVLVGARDGTAFVDISTPTAPRYLGKLPTHATRSTWRDMKVYQNHAFIVADRNRRHGMQVFDLTQLRTLTTTSTISNPRLFSETAHYNGFSDAHNIAINEESGYAYAVGGETCESGLHMLNIQDVNTPTDAGCYTADGYIHDTQCIIYRGPDQDYQGRELCFNSSIDELSIVDVTDKTKPTRLSTVAVKGNIYMHQGWLTPDERYFLLDDEMDEWFGNHNARTYIFDVSDLDAPRFVNAYTGQLPSVDHNLYISGTYAYEANYTTGLRILDIKNVAQGQLSEAGFFDTYPENNEAIMNSAWSAFPFYKSGVVAISTLDRGLFLVKPRLPPDVIFTNRTLESAFCTADPAATPFVIPIELVGRNRYSGTVGLRASQLPSTAMATFSPAQLTMQGNAHATSTLTIAETAGNSNAYTFTVETVGAGDVAFDHTTINLHLSSTLGAAPALQEPRIITDQLATMEFVWSNATNVTDYLVEIAADANFTTIVYTTTVSSATLTLSTPLAYNQQYYWRVQPRNGCGMGERSAIGQFHTAFALFLPVIQQ